jgi:flagellar export protein FliJ
VLDHRKRKEDLAHLDLGQAQSQLVAGLNMLDELEDVQDAILGELSDRRIAGNFDPNESLLYHDYLKKIKECIVNQQRYVADLTSTVEALRLNLVGASQERRVLDIMKTKAQTDHRLETLKQEQNISDDLSASRRQFQALQMSQE